MVPSSSSSSHPSLTISLAEPNFEEFLGDHRYGIIYTKEINKRLRPIEEAKEASRNMQYEVFLRLQSPNRASGSNLTIDFTEKEKAKAFQRVVFSINHLYLQVAKNLNDLHEARNKWTEFYVKLGDLKLDESVIAFYESTIKAQEENIQKTKEVKRFYNESVEEIKKNLNTPSFTDEIASWWDAKQQEALSLIYPEG